jgi:hypothetical protein
VAQLSERLGQEGVRLQELARGVNGRALIPTIAAMEFEEAMEPDTAVSELEPLSFLLGRLLDQLCGRLSARALATNEIRLRMELEPGEEEIFGIAEKKKHTNTNIDRIRRGAALRGSGLTSGAPTNPGIDQVERHPKRAGLRPAPTNVEAGGHGTQRPDHPRATSRLRGALSRTLSVAGPAGAEALRGQIRLNEFMRLACGIENGFGGDVAAADGAFHRGGPAGARPIAGEKKIFDAAARPRAPLIGTGLGRKCRGDFLDHGGFDEVRVARGGQDILQLAHAHLDDFLARARDEIVGRADDELQILPRVSVLGHDANFLRGAVAIR